MSANVFKECRAKCQTVTKIDARISNPDLKEWLNTKQNKSETTREALMLLYNQELNEKEVKPVEVKIIG